MFEREGGASEGSQGDERGQTGGFLVEEADEVGGLGGGFGGEVGGLLGVDDAFVNFVDLREVKLEGLEEALGGGHAADFGGGHPAGDVLRVGREGVGLAVVFKLETVFEMAKELVGAGEAAVFDRREEFFVAEAGESEHGAAMTDPGFAAAVETLEALHEELDIADAAGGELDVDAAGVALAGGELFVDAEAGLGDGFDGGEVERCGIDERFDEGEEGAGGRWVPGGGTGLDKHLQLPVAAAGLIVGLGGVERHDHFAVAAFGTEPEIDAVADAFGGVTGEEIGDEVGDLLRELFVGDDVWSGGVAVGGIEEDEVDVGAVIELFAAELAHGEHRERGRGEAIALGVVGDGAAEGDVEDGVGEVGEFAGGFGEIGEAADVAEENTEKFAAAETGKVDGFGEAGREGVFETSSELIGGAGLAEQRAGAELFEPLGMLEDLFGEEVGVGEDGERGLMGGRVALDAAGGLRLAFAEAGEIVGGDQHGSDRSVMGSPG
jgi:hypothetical protein